MEITIKVPDINVHVFVHQGTNAGGQDFQNSVRESLLLILKNTASIMSAQSDFAASLEALKTEVDGIGTKVDALETALNNSANAVDPAVQAAFNDLKGSVDTLNTKADNVPPVPPAPAP